MAATFDFHSRADRAATLALVLLLVFPGPALAAAGAVSLRPQDPPRQGVLEGRVLDAGSGEAVSYARVSVLGRQGALVATAEADRDGAYAVESVPPGTYAVRASRVGYASRTRAGIRIAAGQRRTLDLELASTPLAGDELVVSASRLSERVLESDASVAVVDGREVSRRRSSTIFGALDGVRGADYFETGLGQQQVNSRGFVGPFSSHLRTLVDGRPVSLPGLMTSLPGMLPVVQEDVEQVELVAGPASALYGSNAAHGVVNVVTRDPRESPGHTLYVGFGNRDQVRISGRAAGKLGERFAYKFAARSLDAADFRRVNTFEVRSEDGTILHAVRDRPDFDISNRVLNGALHFDPSPGTSLVYSAGVSRSDYVNLTVISRLQVQDYDVWYHQLRADLESLGPGSLTAQASYTGNASGESFFLDLAARARIPEAHGGAGLDPAAARETARFVDASDRFDADARYALELGDDHGLMAGAKWLLSRPETRGSFLADGPGEPAIRVRESGGFLAYENRSLDDVRLSLVGRYDHHSDYGGRLSAKLAGTWEVEPGWVLRGGLNRGFDSPATYLLHGRSYIRTRGGLDVVLRGAHEGFRRVSVAAGEPAAHVDPLEPLGVTSVEAGVRGTVGRSVFLDLAVHRSLYSDFVTPPQPISDPAAEIFVVDPETGEPRREITLSYLNYGELPVFGADLGVQFVPTSDLSLEGSVSYQEPGEFREPLAGVPEPSFNVPTRKAKVSGELNDWWGEESYVSLQAVVVDGFDFQGGEVPYLNGRVEAYQVLDLGLGVPLEFLPASRASLEVSIDNLLDHRHVQIPGSPELGRVITAGVRARW